MAPPQKKAILQQWRSSPSGSGPRFLVIFDVQVKPPEVPWSPLIINFDLPRSVEGYAHRAAAAVPPSSKGPSSHQQQQQYGVVVSFVQAAGGDVEMLRSTECAYRFKVSRYPFPFTCCVARADEISLRKYLLCSTTCSLISARTLVFDSKAFTLSLACFLASCYTLYQSLGSGSRLFWALCEV